MRNNLPQRHIGVIQQEKTKGTFTTGTVAPLFKPHAGSSVKAATL